MYVVGIDENGLGPRLGPMITTAVTIDFGDAYDAKKWRKRGLARGLTDSKATASSRRMGFAESVALAVAALSVNATANSDRLASAFIGSLHLDGDVGLRAPCPTSATSALCHGHDLELPAFGGSLEEGMDAIRPLVVGRSTLRIARVRTVVNCVGVLNREHAAGRNKLVLDLAAMERLSLDSSRSLGVDVHSLCGMIGGIRDVPRYASHIAPESYVAREADTNASCRAYDVAGVGSMRFEIDADSGHLPVALASMVGKYLRELAMARIIGLHRASGPSLESVSGYHDPVTARFVEASAPLRRRLDIVDDCFERRG
jgi:ribonuclease HII